MQEQSDKNVECYRKLVNTPYQLIAIMAVIVIGITGLSVTGLYHVGLEQQQQRLVEIVKSRAEMIKVMAQHEAGYETHGNDPKAIAADVLTQVMYAHDQFRGFGKSGEFTLAKRNGAEIRFLLRHRHDSVASMQPIPMASKLAEPMRRALNGKSGTLIGLDYRGATVIAAHEPIPSLGWGIVAKIDLAEIRSPYIEAGLNGMLAALILIIAGGFMFTHIMRPLATEIENGRRYNRMLFSESPIGLALCDMEGKLVDVNPAYAAIIGRSMEETYRLSYWEITPERYASQESLQLEKLLNGGCYGPYEKEYIHKDGHLVQVRLSGCLIRRNGEDFIWSSVEDISEQKRNEEALREASLVFEHTHEGIMITDPQIRIVRANRRFSEITGYALEEIVGKNPRFLQAGVHDKAFYANMWKSIVSDGTWYGELWNKRKNGEHFPSLQSITAVKNDLGRVTGYVSVFSDISDQKANEAKLAHLASHDVMTSLPNRMHFCNNLEKAIHRAKRYEMRLAVLFLDLNRFKEVNDTLGHDSGDLLLKTIAERLIHAVREEDTVARFGGDEFAILLPEIHNSDDAVGIAEKIIEAIGKPLSIEDTTLTPSTSIGISIYPEDGEEGGSLLKAADNAMYRAKNGGDSHYALYREVTEEPNIS